MNRVSMLGELSASLSHELKQPITAAVISANTTLEWLNRKQPDVENARESTATIVTAGMRAAEIIDRLRSLYKKAPEQRQLLDVNEIAGEMIGLLRSEGNRYAVSMRADPAPDLPHVMADRVQLQQVLMNLMLNAIEAMKETGGVLTVKSQPQDGRVVISVSDTGVGLPPEKADQIFNSFFTTKPQKAAAWGWRSAGRSLNPTVVVSGRHPTTDVARRFISLCRPQPRTCNSGGVRS